MLEMLEDVTNVNRVNVDKNERFLSLIGGGILLLYALVRIPIAAILALLAAAYLFFRGIRGFCYIYDQLGQNTAVHLSEIERASNGETAVSESEPVLVAQSR